MKKEPVSMIMSYHIQTVSPQNSLWEVHESMEKHHIRHIPVIEEDEVVGIISRTDLMRVNYGNLNRTEIMGKSLGLTQEQVKENIKCLQTLQVKAVMSPKPYTISPSTSIHDAAEILVEHEFSALPVVENGKIVGMLTSTDLIRFLLSKAK